MQLGPIRRMPSSVARDLELVLQFQPVGDAGLGESGREQVDGTHTLGRGVFEHVEDVGGGDGADHVIDGAGDVGEAGVGGQIFDLVGAGIDGIDVGLSGVLERLQPSARSAISAHCLARLRRRRRLGEEDGVEWVGLVTVEIVGAGR